jgi:parallel beta-helix repeat protein
MPDLAMPDLVMPDLAPCVAPAQGAIHYVDPIQGVDDTTHGGPGACAYRSITFATTIAQGQIALAAGTYSTQNGESVPIKLVGTQQVLCDYTGTQAKIVGGFVFAGTSNVLQGCIIDGNKQVQACVEIEANGSTSNPHLISNCDISNCTAPGIGNGINTSSFVTVQSNTIHDCPFAGIYWAAGSTATMINNRFQNDGTTDIICPGANTPNVTGSGNIDVGTSAMPSCNGCTNCGSF